MKVFALSDRLLQLMDLAHLWLKPPCPLRYSPQSTGHSPLLPARAALGEGVAFKRPLHMGPEVLGDTLTEGALKVVQEERRLGKLWLRCRSYWLGEGSRAQCSTRFFPHAQNRGLALTRPRDPHGGCWLCKGGLVLRRAVRAGTRGGDTRGSGDPRGSQEAKKSVFPCSHG